MDILNNGQPDGQEAAFRVKCLRPRSSDWGFGVLV